MDVLQLSSAWREMVVMIGWSCICPSCERSVSITHYRASALCVWTDYLWRISQREGCMLPMSALSLLDAISLLNALKSEYLG